MNKLIYVFISIAIILIIYNATYLDFNNLLDGESKTAIISILAGACVIFLMLILKISRKIAAKSN